jgi:hypothetical protein
VGLTAATRCSCCGQAVPPRCLDCGVYAKTDRPIPTHMTDHDIQLADEGGHCTTCGLPTKERHGRLGHVYDHPARIAESEAAE